ncbi:MAG: hypothetical protein OXT49_02710, partial [Gammaproteobacteria bacterium]|nr:hypothetical protein [Gammaproteobacteria bacterium]
MFRYVATTTLLICLAFIAGCSTLKPDLARLYSLSDDNDSFQPPVIIVPGIVSSTLVDENDKEIWFGPLRKLLSSEYRDMALGMDPDTLNPKPSKIKAGRLPETVLTKDFYGPIFDTLEDAGNYKLSQPGEAWNGRDRRYYKFPYDWRLSNDVTARKLDAFIEQVRKDYNRPNMRVDLIGHSMGGLVIRYFLRYGTEDVLNDNRLQPTQAGADKANRVILLGSPNLGSLASFEELVKGYKLIFSRVPTEVLVTMPAIYQLLPHPINHWLIDIKGEKLDEDLFDIATWKKYQWSIFDPDVRKRISKEAETKEAAEKQLALLEAYMHKHLERARRFVWSLTVKMDQPRYQLINFGGDCSLTPARVLMESVNG